MRPTVRALAEHPALGLRLHAGTTARDRRISWVHASELLDPTPFLDGDELLLTAGLMLCDQQQPCAEYVGRIAAACATGIGFGIELGHDRIPTELLRAAEAADLPVLEVPHRTPFIAISKTITQWLTEEAGAEARRGERARAALTRTALRAGGLDGLAAHLAEQLGGWTLFLDAHGEPTRAEPATAWQHLALVAKRVEQLRRTRAPASATVRTQEESIAVQSLGSGTEPVGFLAVGRRTRFNATDQHIIHIAAALLSVALAPADPAADARMRTVALRLLLEGRHDLFEQLGFELPRGRLVVLACTGSPDQLTHDTGLFAAELDGELIVLAPADRRPPSARHIGISAPDTGDIGTACRQARRALHDGIRRGSAVTRFEHLGLGIFTQMSGISVDGALRPLLEHDRNQRGDLVASLQTWLACHGQWEPAAARLGVHRHTLRNRIEKAEALLDRGLDSPDVRAELWFALRLQDGLSSPTGGDAPDR